MGTIESSELEDDASLAPSARVKIEDFTESLESLLETQRQALEELRESSGIPDGEKATRLFGIQQSIEAIVKRLEEEETKNAGYAVRRAQLEEARKQGLKMLESMSPDSPRH